MFGIRQTLAAAAGILLLAGTVHAAEVFTITSSAFKDGALLAKKNAGDNKSNPNCVGENVSPPLAWSNVPAGTTSLALVMTDPEGRGTGVDHWIAYGIPASVTAFAEGETSKPSDKYVGGIGTAKQSIYMG
ncbi:MAG: YbhB/YbcL family Raf kinase inhibitor-like protein, partial [Pseudolabrys sp.]